MKMKFFRVLLATIALFLVSPLFSFAEEEIEGQQITNVNDNLHDSVAAKGEYIEGEVVVKFKDNVSVATQEQIILDINGKVKPTPSVVKERFIVLQVDDVDQTISVLKNNPHIEYVEPNYILKATWSPNDPFFSPSYQYGLFNTSASSAWDVTRGSSNQEIAILDTGVDFNHPDLRSKTILGYDFVDRNYVPNDSNGHGTHVAGIAAADTNNGIGIAGMAPNTQILAVRVLDANGSGSLANIANGIYYAADYGAEVINLSLGCACDTQTLENAVNYAWNRGSVVVAAAGNDGTMQQFQPASYANAIAVGAVDQSNNRASFSNYGTWVDVAAPGVDIASTYPNNRYVYLSGTSMASPYVAGQAALLTGQGKNNTQVRAAIQNTTDNMNGSGFYVRYGVINAYQSVTY